MLGSQGHTGNSQKFCTKNCSFPKYPLLTCTDLKEYPALLKITCLLTHFPKMWNRLSSTI